MLLFRKFLVRIRQEYRINFRRFFIYSSLLSLVFIAAGIIVDVAFPFGGIWTVMRSMLLIPSSFTLFILVYGLGLFMHNARVNSNPDWVPYRNRWSPSWRRRISAVVLAILIVIILTVGQDASYMFINSLVGAALISIVAFIRYTKVEEDRANLGIPNVQDLQFDSFNRMREKRREQAKQGNKKVNKEKK